MGEIEGHHHRVSRMCFHPSGRFLGTAWYVELAESIYTCSLVDIYK